MPHGAGIVHQCGDPAQLAVDPIEQRDHFVFDADIGAHRNGLRTQCADLLQHTERRLFIGLIVDADPIALSGGQQGCSGSNAAAAAGDDDDFFHASFPRFKRKRSGARITVLCGFCMGLLPTDVARELAPARLRSSRGTESCRGPLRDPAGASSLATSQASSNCSAR
ncbi:hypothetical protein D3C87_1491900 [compost metagenome]